MNFYTDLLTELEQKTFSEKELTQLKRKLALKYHLKKIPTQIEILLQVPLDKIALLKKKLITKPVRTISGVSPVAIMTPPDKCPHGKCTFCPGGLNSPWGDTPQSYTGHEPATMRAKRNRYDAYLQVFNRLEQYILLGHDIGKVELIIMSGTFTSRPKEEQEKFIKDAYQAMNDFSRLFFYVESEVKNGSEDFDYFKFQQFFELPGELHDPERIKSVQEKILTLKQSKQTSLEQEQSENETANVRCVALCIETRPDHAYLEQGNEMLRLGCTRVELGIESVYDDVLKHVNRGHTVADSKRSIQILRDLGFKINFHYMPGMPLTTVERDLAGMKELFSSSAYRPDMLKIYPCMVAEGTELLKEFKNGKFTPLSTENAAKLLVEFKKYVPEYCRIQRIQRDVPTKYWTAGIDRTNFRQHLMDNYEVKCRCIRCREPVNKTINWDKVELKTQEYDASGGKEFFISVDDTANDILIGFCRMRFPGQFLRPEITKDSALIRELHVYGTATALGQEGNIQHRGWGKKLIARAEEIAKQHGKKKIVVIAGVGVKEYYRKLGYKKEGVYMVKEI